MLTAASEQLPDRVVLQQWLLSGEQAAFEAVFRAYYGRVYALAYRLLGCRAAADDVAQEVFLKLYRHPLQPGREHNLLAWLLTVASNLAYNSIRADRRRLARETLSEMPGQDSPIESAEQALAAARVRAALAELPERQARLLLLRQADLSYAECAQALGVSPSSIGTLLARAERAFVERFTAEAQRAQRRTG